MVASGCLAPRSAPFVAGSASRLTPAPLAAVSLVDKGAQDVSATLAPIIEKAGIPGMVAVVLRGDQIAAQGAAGVRRKGAPERVTLDDAFEICSCTKAMTATLAAALIEEGRLRWDSTLGEIFGRAVPALHAEWRPVTIRQLLSHQSGLEGTHVAKFLAALWSSAVTSTAQRRSFVAKIIAGSPDAAPGAKHVYSVPNYLIAAAAMEEITGASWEELMHARLFAPLGMTSAGFGPPGTPGRVDQPWGHGRLRLGFVPLPGPSGIAFDPGSGSADFPAMAAPAGLVHLNVRDWAKFVAVQLRGHPANPQRDPRLLRAETFAQFHQPAPGEKEFVPGWMFGTRPWAKGSRPGDTGRVLFHQGDNGRWNCVVWLAPEIDFALIIACNRGSTWSDVDKVAAALLKFAPRPSGAD